jgi:hypothetical protein
MERSGEDLGHGPVEALVVVVGDRLAGPVDGLFAGGTGMCDRALEWMSAGDAQIATRVAGGDLVAACALGATSAGTRRRTRGYRLVQYGR